MKHSDIKKFAQDQAPEKGSLASLFLFIPMLLSSLCKEIPERPPKS